MNNEKKQEKEIKITDLYSSSVYFVPRTLDDAMVDKLTKTALKLVLKLNRYFSSETGRKNQRNVYRCSELRKELGINDKPISLICFLDIIKQVKDNNLFLIYQNDNTKDKEFTFFLPSENNKAIFEAVEKDEKYFKNKITTHVLDNNIVKLDTNKSTKKDEKITNSTLENTNSSFIFTNCSFKNTNSSFTFANSSFINQNCSFIFSIPETVVNVDNFTFSKTCQDYYIKDYLYKETYIHKEENLKSDNSTLEIKESIASEEKNVTHVFLNDGLEEEEEIEEVKYDDLDSEEKLLNDEIEQENNEPIETPKVNEKIEILPDEIDEVAIEKEKLKEILIYDYGFFNKDALDFVDKFSTKCIRESIDILIAKIDSGFTCENEGKYLRGIINNWKEKKETTGATSVPKIISQKPLLDGEISFIEFMKSKKYLTHTFNQDINNAVKTMIYNLHYEKANMIEFKELFTKEMIDTFINKVEIENRFFSTNIGGQWYKELKFNDEKALFWQAFNSPDSLPEPKKLTEKGLNDNLFSMITKKTETKEIKETKKNSFNDTEYDLDNEDIPQ